MQTFEVDGDKIADAARVFYGFAPRAPDFLQNFRVALQKADPAIKMSGNDQEIAVLAGAVLVEALEQLDEPLCFFAALAAVCPAAKNLRKTPIVPAIPELATEALAKWSTDRFTSRLNCTPNGKPSLAADGLKKLKEICATGDLTALDDPLTKIYSAVQEVQKCSLEMRMQLSIQSEETNMLWWLFGEHSRDTKKPFRTYTTSAASLIAGKELADLTLELPGPVAAVAFLDRLTRATRKKFPEFVSIESAVNDAPDDWKQSFLNRNNIDALSNLAPVLNALKAASSVPKGESWLAIYKHATGVEANAHITPSDLADQVYLEGLLFHAWTISNE